MRGTGRCGASSERTGSERRARSTPRPNAPRSTHTQRAPNRNHGRTRQHEPRDRAIPVPNVKTVEMHLTNAYRKLGVRSRRDLLEALAARPPAVISTHEQPGSAADLDTWSTISCRLCDAHRRSRAARFAVRGVDRSALRRSSFCILKPGVARAPPRNRTSVTSAFATPGVPRRRLLRRRRSAAGSQRRASALPRIRWRLPRAAVSVSTARRATLGTRAYTGSAPCETRLFHLIDTGTELTEQRDLAKLVENCARRRMDEVIA